MTLSCPMTIDRALTTATSSFASRRYTRSATFIAPPPSSVCCARRRVWGILVVTEDVDPVALAARRSRPMSAVSGRPRRPPGGGCSGRPVPMQQVARPYRLRRDRRLAQRATIRFGEVGAPVQVGIVLAWWSTNTSWPCAEHVGESSGAVAHVEPGCPGLGPPATRGPDSTCP